MIKVPPYLSSKPFRPNHWVLPGEVNVKWLVRMRRIAQPKMLVSVGQKLRPIGTPPKPTSALGFRLNNWNCSMVKHFSALGAQVTSCPFDPFNYVHLARQWGRSESSKQEYVCAACNISWGCFMLEILTRRSCNTACKNPLGSLAASLKRSSTCGFIQCTLLHK